MKHDPTLYEPKLPASTCSIGSLIGPAIGVVGSLIGGSRAADAAEEAADVQGQAARESVQLQREMYNVGRADQGPYRASGAGALQTMNNMFLPGGHPMVQMQGRLSELRAQRARLMGGGQEQAAPAPAQAPWAPPGAGFIGGEGGSGGSGGSGFDVSQSGFNFGNDAEDSGGDWGGSSIGGGGAGGGPAAGGGYHHGGSITDHNPGTYRENMQITAQEGEVVMSRGAVEMLGRDFLDRANRKAR